MTPEPPPAPLDAPVPLRGGERPVSTEKPNAWEDAVPVRIAAERAEAEERKARLRLVLGRRR
jgi:hypothetical protein